MIPVIGLMYYFARGQEDYAMTEIETNMFRLVRMAASQEDRSIEGARQLLVTMSKYPEFISGDSRKRHRLLSAFAKENPLYSNFGIVDLNGNIIASSRPIPKNVNFSSRSFFRRTVQTRDFTVGHYMKDSYSRKATIQFGYPLLDDKNRMVAVSFVELDSSWLERFYDEALLPEGSIVTVFDAEGVVLMRYPKKNGWEGKQSAASAIFQYISSRQDGTARTAGLDGIQRIFAFTRLVGRGKEAIFIAIGVSETVAFKKARHAFHWAMAGIAIISFLSIIAAWMGSNWFILRRARALLEATKRLSYGDSNAHTGIATEERPDELGQLATAFDEMAASLKKRENELIEPNHRSMKR
jgi:HAMP domain-containing protein